MKESLDVMAETTQEIPSALKLEDYSEDTLEPDIKENRVSRQVAVNEDSEIKIESTTIESSTIAMKLEQESSGNDFVALSPPTEGNSPQNNYVSISSYFPYPPSRNPSAQHVSIPQSPYLPPKSFYKFYPSQPDYNYIPYYCLNFIHHKFIPNVHDTSTYYHHRWK